MEIKVYILDVFSKAENGGNSSGVVLDADGLSEAGMQAAAAKVGCSETAFLQESDRADFKVRFFTPRAEVDLCGHATIAAFSLLAREGRLGPGQYAQQTGAGILKVECRPGNVVYMEQNKPDFGGFIDREELARSLNTGVDAFMPDYPARIVSTGLRDILIPIADLKRLHEIEPDYGGIASISKKYDVIGYHLFTLDTLYSSTAHCRNFAPLYEIPEEAATGTSNGALGCYLYRYGLVSSGMARHMTFEQGYSMGRPSEVLAALTVDGGEILRVLVGGTAQNPREMEINIT